MSSRLQAVRTPPSATCSQWVSAVRRRCSLRPPPSLRGGKRRSNPSRGITESWIALRSLSSGAHSRDPVARNDEKRRPPVGAASCVSDLFKDQILFQGP